MSPWEIAGLVAVLIVAGQLLLLVGLLALSAWEAWRDRQGRLEVLMLGALFAGAGAASLTPGPWS